ncbi:hypothetical protein LZC95_20430 [Pendulispora brunnea]|uniref:Uncharacterized protein n=1 Tax=Pendulispora brunnea TaxID=2905690 RepID=A0ABZ2KKH9_9BACT
MADALPRITEARAAVEDARNAWQEYRVASSRQDELRHRHQFLQDQVAGLTQRVESNRAVLAEADTIRRAAHQARSLDANLAELVSAHDAATQAVTADRVVLQSHERQIVSLHAQMGRAAARRDRALRRAPDRDAVAGAAVSLPAVQQALQAATLRRDELLAAMERVREERFGVAERRIDGMEASLLAVASGIPEPQAEARGALDRDRELVERARSSPEREAQLTAQAQAAKAEALALAASEAELAILVRRGPEVAAAEGDAAEAQSEIKALQDQLDAERVAVALAEKSLRLDEERRRSTSEALSTLRRERAALEGTLAKVGPLTNAETRLAELEPQLEDRGKELVRVEASLAEMVVAAPTSNLASLSAALDTLESRVRGAERELAVAEAGLAHSTEARERTAALRAERARVEADVSDWTRLGEDLGRHGLQSLEIDAVGPELTAICNHLLHTCVGPQWTTIFDAAGDCVLRVLDTESGREATPESLCGGEKVIVGEAISLSLVVLDCRRRGWQECTIVRDESGAALDPENARRYIQMLRRAADLAGARQVLFVSHNPEIQELADVRLDVANGRVSVSEQQNAA